MRLIYPYFRKNLFKIFAGILCMILVNIIQLSIPQIVKRTIDSIFNPDFEYNFLVFQALFIVVAGFFMAVFRYGWRNLLMSSARDLEKGIRDKLYNHILNLDMTFLDKTRTGDIMTHAVSDINHVRMAFGFGLIVIVDTIMLGGATLVIMWWTNPKLTFFAMLPMPFLIIMTKALGAKMNTFHNKAQESYSTIVEMLRESFSGIRIIRVYNLENLIIDKVNKVSKNYFEKNFNRAFITALFRPLLVCFLNLSTLVVVFYGGSLVIKQSITSGELVAFFQYLGIIAWPVIAIGWMTNLYQKGMVSLKRINVLLNTKSAITSFANDIEISDFKGDINFENISFSYNNETSILSDINLKISGSKWTGISGHPGSGKTSLIQLIPRLYNQSKGKILVDNTNIENVNLERLRQNIALMPQEPFIFSGTIRENILMGHAVGLKRLEEVIFLCCLESMLKQNGLDTIVGERGVTLSGGQKQRIALARTLLIEKPIIILDDPISHIDTETASKIIKNLKTIDSTFIIISHRISLLISCDKTYIFHKGEIQDCGTHEELLQKNLFYEKCFIAQKL